MRSKLEGIYRRHRQGLFTVALSITRCPALAEDAIHEAFARMWKSQHHPSGDGLAYVFSAVRNAAVDQVRRQSAAERAGQAASIYDDAPSDDPAEMSADAERDRLLRQSLEGLPLEQREAVVLRVYAGLKFEQMADVTGESLSTVASRYRRAMETLRGRVQRFL